MKNIGKVFMTLALMMLFAIQARSQNSTAPIKQQDQKQTVTNPSPGTFVDKDNNGICDNFESRSGMRRGANFVDKNNDGICDNRAHMGKKIANSCRQGQGNRYRHGQHLGRCCGNGFRN